MDLSTFPPIAVVLDSLYQLVTGFGTTLAPLVGSSSTALAIVALTLAVRLLLVPASFAQVRAEVSRRRLAPAIARLRTRYAGRPEQLQKALTQPYTHEKVSPLAGCLPTLAQAPILSAVYALFVHPNLAGHANFLLAQSFAGLLLGANLFAVLGAGLPHVWVLFLLLAVLAVVVEVTRRSNHRWMGNGDTARHDRAAQRGHCYGYEGSAVHLSHLRRDCALGRYGLPRHERQLDARGASHTPPRTHA